MKKSTVLRANIWLFRIAEWFTRRPQIDTRNWIKRSDWNKGNFTFDLCYCCCCLVFLCLFLCTKWTHFLSFSIHLNTQSDTHTHFFHSQAFPMNFVLSAFARNEMKFFLLIYLWYNLFVVRTHAIKINIVVYMYGLESLLCVCVQCICEFFCYCCCSRSPSLKIESLLLVFDAAVTDSAIYIHTPDTTTHSHLYRVYDRAVVWQRQQQYHRKHKVHCLDSVRVCVCVSLADCARVCFYLRTYLRMYE